jgi:exopolysaccharide biosynthesis protein
VKLLRSVLAFYTVVAVSIATALPIGYLGVVSVRAQEKNIPPRSLLVAEHLRTLSFKKVVPGIQALKIIASNGVELIALRLKPDGLKFVLALQASAQGEWVSDMGMRHNGQVAFNGGFFSINKKGEKLPVGLLMKNNVLYSSRWKKSGGYLVFREGDISILQTSGNPAPVGDAVLQSKPVLIEPGAKWAMNTNRAVPKKRTMVCVDKAGDVIVVAIISGGLSLYEAGWLMREPEVGGYFGCDGAIAMDGGGSTQIWVKDRPDLSFSGETPVHNGVVIQLQ